MPSPDTQLMAIRARVEAFPFNFQSDATRLSFSHYSVCGSVCGTLLCQ